MSILFIPFDHLHRDYCVLKKANKNEDVVVLVESASMIAGAEWHPERLFFLISSARHFAAELRAEGFQVRYIKAQNTLDGIKQVQQEVSKVPVISAEPSSFRMTKSLADHGVQFVANDFFLTPRELFASWASSQKS
jgi:deoxyribodipyrimidine photolyase-related protein